MTKRTLLAVVFSLCAASAFAADKPPVWVGGFLVTDAAGTGCADVNIQNNEMYTAVFHPKLAGDASVTTDVLQILTFQKAFQFIPKPGPRFQTAGNYGTAEWTGRATVKKFAGTYSGLVISPAPTPTRQFINIKGKFAKIDGLNCTVTFQAALSLKD